MRSKNRVVLVVLAVGAVLIVTCVLLAGTVFLAARSLRSDTRPLASVPADISLPHTGEDKGLIEPDATPAAAAPPAASGAGDAAASPSVEATAPALAQSASAVDRLVVIAGDGNVYTVRPDGLDRVALTDDASEARLYRQPTWSPDGKRVAWAEIVTYGSQVRSTLHIVPGGPNSRSEKAAGDAGPAGIDMGEYAPFYLSWSPDGTEVAALSNWSEGLALRMVPTGLGSNGHANSGDPAAPGLVLKGSPLYFTWSPDSRQVLAHVDGDRLSVLTVAGEEQRLAAQAGLFGAPDWSADGQHLLYVERRGPRQRLVQATPDGTLERELSGLLGTASFALSPDGKRLAYVDTVVDVATAAFGTLNVADLETGQEQRVTPGPVLGFWWSPAGTRLAYLMPGTKIGAPRASADPAYSLAHTEVWLRWKLWDGTENPDLSQFSPSDTFLVDYLRFFDQSARSMTPWAPDGRAFAYAGEGEDGSLGVWVQPVEAGSRPTRIGDGVYAAWSPR